MANLFERLEIPETDLIAVGTLHLRGLQVQSLVLENACSSNPAWVKEDGWADYVPGLLHDESIQITLPQKRSPQKRKTDPSMPRWSHKRKRSKSSSISTIASQTSLAASSPATSYADIDEESLLPSNFPSKPTIHDLDHLVRNVFARAEFKLIASHDAVKTEDGQTYRDVLFRVWVVPSDCPGLNHRIAANGLKIRSTTAKINAQKAFYRLFHHLKYETLEWGLGRPVDSSAHLLARNLNPPSLLELYNHLKDPIPDELVGLDSASQAILEEILQEDAPEGMSSRLFDFQKHCLWKLVSRELAPQRQIDLTMQRLVSVDMTRRPYYLDASMQARRTPQFYREPKAAIVAEGMGTGKTCICLALILSLRHHLANVDFDAAHPSHMTTVRTERYESFPWAEEDLNPVENMSAKGPEAWVDPQCISRVPSLRDLALDMVSSSLHQRKIQIPFTFHEPSERDYPYLWEIPPMRVRDDTRSSGGFRRKVYISAATLVIVPDILIAQWLAEINKHVLAGALDYIKLEKYDTTPEAEDLCQLDLILVSESKIRNEETRFWYQAPPPCQCPYIGNTREILCRCEKKPDMGASPLVSVYWKRLIVDEGHKVAGHGDLVRLCMRLRTEARYVVSGTPSKNLVGLHDVKQEDQENFLNNTADADKQDFERLASIANFIGLQPFSGEESSRQLFMRAFYEPYAIRGDTSGISTFLARVVVRHRIPDFALPPLTRRTVVLPFNDLERMTYNVLLALFASNSVLSERTDEDYFFHPKQKAHLNALINNLGAAHLLFSSTELLTAALGALDSVEKGYAKNQEKEPSARWSTMDELLIQEAAAHLRLAISSATWRYAQTGSMLYELRHIPSELLLAWGGLDAECANQKLLSGEKVSTLRYQIGKMAQNGDILADGDEFLEDLITFAHKEAKRREDEDRRLEMPKGDSPKKKVKREPANPSTRKAANEAYKKAAGLEKVKFTFNDIPLSSDLPNVEIPSITSSKVAYVVQSILRHPEEKFLIFAGGSSSSAQVAHNNLYYLSEALDLAKIPYLIFVRGLTQDRLAEHAKAFNDTSAFRALLLDLRFAGRGLTLSKASRIIFTEPVWHKDEEAQAVKRAHRLGQDRPVFVETLVMKDSFEEQVMKRGAELSRQEMADSKTPYQDRQLSNALRGMVFLQTPSEQDTVQMASFMPALRLIPQDLCDPEQYKQDVLLAQLRQEAKEQLDAQLTSHASSRNPSYSLSRASSTSRSRSTTSRVISSMSTTPPAIPRAQSSGRSKPFSQKRRILKARFDSDEGEDCYRLQVPGSPKSPLHPYNSYLQRSMSRHLETPCCLP